MAGLGRVHGPRAQDCPWVCGAWPGEQGMKPAVQSVTAERGGGGWGFWVGWFEFERPTPGPAVSCLWGVAQGQQRPSYQIGTRTQKLTVNTCFF